MRTLDCRGKTCPEAAGVTRKALEEMEYPLEVKLDSAAVQASVSQMLGTSGYRYQTIHTPQETKLVVTGKHKGGGGRANAVWLITSNTLGRGDEQLGLALMKSFLHTMARTGSPGVIYFLNSGVKLCAGAEALVEYMRELEDRHWRLECCGTCLDYFGIKDQVRVGGITGMQQIVQGMAEADKVITL